MDKIFVAGHQGMVGSAIVRELRRRGYQNIITRSRGQLDLTNQAEVSEFFHKEKFDQVYLAAAKVGGIYANNTYPAEFIYQNIMIQANVIHQSFVTGVRQLLFLGSSCIYPKIVNQPIKEEYLLSAKLEPTNEPYAIAKISGIKLCESYNKQYGKSLEIDYRSIMPTNLYGPGDTYDLMNSHVIPALLMRFHEAKIKKDSEVIVWGSGMAIREFMFSEDLASAAVFVMNLDAKKYQEAVGESGFINIGTGNICTIKELSEKIASTVEFKGSIKFDNSKPDGAPIKVVDSSILKKFGWKHDIDLDMGLKIAYKDFLSRNIL